MADTATSAPVQTMADLLGKTLPALSATSDMPEGEPATAIAAVDNTAPASKTDPAAAPEKVEAASDGDDAGDKANAADDGDKLADDLPAYAKREITKARNKQRAADERAAAAEKAANDAAAERSSAVKALEALAPKPEDKPAVVETPRPTRDKYDTPEAYDEALTSWGREQGAKAEAARNEAARIETERKTSEDARVAEFNTAARSFADKREKAMAEIPDYVEVAESQEVQITAPMVEAIVRAENGPQIAYHLGKNRAEATRIAALPPGAQLFELGRLSATLAAPPPAPKPVPLTKASDPINPVGARSTATEKTADEMNMDEYAAAAERRLYPQRFRTPAQPRPH